MYIELSLTLHCPQEHAWQIFLDPAYLPRWQPSLVAIEPLTEAPGTVGACTRLTYQAGRRTITLRETVEECLPPHRYRCRYDAPWMVSTIQNTFTRQKSTETGWTIIQETRFRGLGRVIGPLTRGITIRTFRTDMARFKALAEA